MSRQRAGRDLDPRRTLSFLRLDYRGDDATLADMRLHPIAAATADHAHETPHPRRHAPPGRDHLSDVVWAARRFANPPAFASTFMRSSTSPTVS
jgi:hypothetical protein